MSAAEAAGTGYRMSVGTPSGQPTFRAYGAFTIAEEADPLFARNRALVAEAATTLGAEVDTLAWADAHEAAQRFLAAPPAPIRDLPHFALEQIVTQSLVFRYPEVFRDPSRAAETRPYIDALARNNHPNPAPVADYLSSGGRDLDPADRRAMARQARDASVTHRRAAEAQQRAMGCADCLSNIIDATPRRMRAEAALAAIARGA